MRLHRDDSSDNRTMSCHCCVVGMLQEQWDKSVPRLSAWAATPVMVTRWRTTVAPCQVREVSELNRSAAAMPTMHGGMACGLHSHLPHEGLLPRGQEHGRRDRSRSGKFRQVVVGCFVFTPPIKRLMTKKNRGMKINPKIVAKSMPPMTPVPNE